MKLRAPYNFIPLSESVFYPDWADEISFEMPFTDGLSGVIDVTLTAKSPIFVRNGLSKIKVTDEVRRDPGKNEYNRFNHIVDRDGNDRNFIPGSSVKGMLHSTVEIISNGKFAQVENQSFGKRNLNDNEYRNAMQKALCGWMYVEDGEWKVEDHGAPQKVNVGLLNKILPKSYYDLIGNAEALNRDENKTADSKYRLLLVKENKFSEIDLFSEIFEKKLKIRYSTEKRVKTIGTKNGSVEVRYTVVTSVDNEENNKRQGHLVLTGQQGVYQEGKSNPGKHHEFIFPLDPQEKYTVRLVSEDVVRAFRTIHANSDDWIGLWADQLLNRGKRIPVFFCKDNNGNVTSIGLASMYKYPYKNSVYDVIPVEYREDKPDLAECMFGYSREVQGELKSLKGRVQVGHFFAASPKEEGSHKLILGTPHPSYYPLYVKDGKTWDEAVEVNGRKFYPIRKGKDIETLPDDKTVLNRDGELTGSAIAICPLAAETAFSGKIRFFNLKPFELGALVSALTLNHTLFNDDKQRYHLIGMGKPLGYGKISVTVNDIKVIGNSPERQEWDNKTVEDCIFLFKQGVSGDKPETRYNFDDWKNQKTGVCEEFRAMTSESEFVDLYMTMTTDPKTDEFRLMKESRGLPRFTKVTKGNISDGTYNAVVVSRKIKQDSKVIYGVSLRDFPDIKFTTKPFFIKDRNNLFNIKDKVCVTVENDRVIRIFK